MLGISPSFCIITELTGFQHFEADPEDVPDLTRSILSQLQTLPAAEPSLPSEPFQLPRIKYLSLECAAHSSSKARREALVQGYLA